MTLPVRRTPGGLAEPPFPRWLRDRLAEFDDLFNRMGSLLAFTRVDAVMAERFGEVRSARETLRDPVRRAACDQAYERTYRRPDGPGIDLGTTNSDGLGPGGR
ncbi:hypothetical protein [Streptomyces sp. OE57]|uniref:hypothetical protein n=1 Tax=Streptomyces lacaronensis TaxID=3379885 RepID=UPI0039B74D28